MAACFRARFQALSVGARRRQEITGRSGKIREQLETDWVIRSAGSFNSRYPQQVGPQNASATRRYELIVDRSLLLGRRNQKSLSRGSVAAQQPSPNVDDMSNDGPQRDERGEVDDDDDAHDNTIEFDLTGSSDAMALQDISISSDYKIDDAMGTAQFQEPPSISVTQISTSSMFEPQLTDTARQVQIYGELPTPASETLSWFDPLETTTPHGVASQTSWSGKSTMDEPLFQNSGFCDIGCFDVPGNRGESRSVGCVENSSNTSAYIHNENAGEHRKKGSVTLTLSQVDPYIAQEIMGSVLKHSAGLKIQCVVNDS
ncbi:MAG: hypothetical protein M1822_008233 [Bathelium mastoideum]|nr:MAG: hypothetical protein M1822_008233 [Bathelium mastoideum]